MYDLSKSISLLTVNIVSGCCIHIILVLHSIFPIIVSIPSFTITLLYLFSPIFTLELSILDLYNLKNYN